ncbi:hypothetical protein PG993_013568 [Apiospora rasikravindrae]|uniref:Uncharacterized protein n=1 Tax=Apiospora rasikravindrae TaxID=990691 RepID=A0ABR1RY06_9PEZI
MSLNFALMRTAKAAGTYGEPPESRYPVLIPSSAADTNNSSSGSSAITSPEELQALAGLSEVPEAMAVKEMADVGSSSGGGATLYEKRLNEYERKML